MALTDHQRAALDVALSKRIGILGGGPGTGKTYTVAEMIRECMAKGISVGSIQVAAPTGKAAVRVTETLAAAGLATRASTWHSTLSGGGDSFKHNERDPLPCKVLIGDEHSMVDTDLQSAILRARPAGAITLFVGDVNQLTPVGHGAPLRDMIAAGVPYGELTEIKRNDGGIVEACHQIRQGKPWKCEGNLEHVPATNPDEQVSKIISTVRGIRQRVDPDGNPYNPISDCQVVCAVNDRSKVSRKSLNGLLQNALNPDGKTAGDNPFRVGDKIINLENGYVPLHKTRGGRSPADAEARTNAAGEVYVANGEQGIVREVFPNRTVAEITAPRRVVLIPRATRKEQAEKDPDRVAKTNTGCAWDLAYAISVHKSQGSEWPFVVAVIDEYSGARYVCSREWFYTAISRARKWCYVVGNVATANRFCRRTAINKRRTFLRERIAEANAIIALDAI